MIEERNDELTKDEELELGRKIQKMKKIKERMASGYDKLTKEESCAISEGEEALEILTLNYCNLARKIAHDYHKKTKTKYSIEDLIQDAMSALIKAALDFDPAKNCKLSTYAFYGISKEVSKTINLQRLVRMPENRMGQYVQISNAQKEFNELPIEEQQKYSNELEYIYLNVDIKKEDVDLILSNMQQHVSLNSPLFEGKGEFVDMLVDEQAEQEVVQFGNIDQKLTDIIEKLNQFERDLLAFDSGLFPASLSYTKFLEKHKITDKKAKAETRKVIRKMRKMAEQ